jgi:hypothetical protein
MERDALIPEARTNLPMARWFRQARNDQDPVLGWGSCHEEGLAV